MVGSVKDSKHNIVTAPHLEVVLDLCRGQLKVTLASAHIAEATGAKMNTMELGQLVNLWRQDQSSQDHPMPGLDMPHFHI